jgi:hypothetical protein
MPCRVIYPVEPGGEKVQSQTWNKLYKELGDAAQADTLYKKMLTSEFREEFGDWLTARQLTSEGFYPSLDEALKNHQVKVPVNEIGEPELTTPVQKFIGLIGETPLDKLEKQLVEGFLSDFGITSTEYADMREALGVNVASMSDIVTKSIAYEKGESLLPEVAFFAYQMLGKNNNKIKSELKFLINKWDRYQERFEFHRKVVSQEEGFIADKAQWKNKIRDRVIVDFLREAMEKHYTSPEAFEKQMDSKWTREDFTMWQRFVKTLEDFLVSFGIRVRSSEQRKEKLRNLGASIADEVVNQNYQYFDYQKHEDQIQKYYKQTIDSDPVAKDLVQKGQSLGLILTGSLALRKAGTVYRTEDETIHDIDFVVPYELLVNQPELLAELQKLSKDGNNLNATSVLTLPLVQKTTWFKDFIKEYPSFKVTNGFYGDKHETFTLQGVVDGEFYQEDGFHEEKVSFYVKDPETKQPVKQSKTVKVKHKKGDWIKDTGYVLDFFVRLKPGMDEHEHYFKLWKEIMVAKLRMGRDKDFIDWKHYEPYLKSKDAFNFNLPDFTHVTPRNTVAYNRTPDDLNTEAIAQEHAEEIVTKVLDGLSQRLGVEYQIISEKEAEELTKDSQNPWAGEKAFFHGGKVYLLQGAVTLENGIHEFAHPFIRAISQSNPKVFASVFSSIAATQEGQEIIAEVTKLYPELAYDNPLFQEEVVVRAVTARAMNQAPTKEFQTALQKLLFHIKQLLRKVFGSAIQIEKLTENTTVDQLAEMLMKGDFKLETQLITQNDLVAFKRDVTDLIQELERVKEDAINKHIDGFYDVITNHLNRIYKNNHYEDLRKLSQNQAGRSQFATMKDLLVYAQKVKDTKEKARNLAHTMLQIEILTQKILEHVQELNKLPESQETLNTLTYYGYILSDWANFIDKTNTELRKDGVSVRSEVADTLSKIENNIRETTKIMTDNNEKVLLGVLSEMLAPVKKNIDERFDEEINRLQAAYDAGNTSVRPRLEEAKKKKKQFDLSNESLKKYLAGDMGDTNFASGLLEAYISSPDPIVGGFAKFLKMTMYEVQANAHKFDNDMRSELTPALQAAGYSQNDPAEMGKKITQVETLVIVNPETGETTERKVISLMSPFKGYRGAIAQMKYEIRKLRDENRDDEADQKQQELNQEMVDYFHQEYTDEFYKRGEIWKTPVGRMAYKKRTDIFDQVKNLEEQMDTVDDSTRDQYLAQIEILWKEYKMLGSTRDLNGDLKIGDDLEIAKTIQEYNTNNRKFYEWVEKKGLFETRYNEFKQSLLDSGLLETSDEYQKKVEEWVTDNTRRVIKPEFYEKRKDILDKIAAIVSKLPQSEQKDLDMGTVWTDIIDLVMGYRDEDGQPIGTEMSDERIRRVRELQEKANEIHEKYAAISGLSRPESKRLEHYFDKIRSGGRLNAAERNDMNTLIAQQKENSLDAMEKAKLFRYIEELKALQSKVASDYYIEIVNNYLSKNDKEPIDPSTSNEWLENDAEIGALMASDADFKKWFEENHLEVERWDADAQEVRKYYQRLYVWNRIQPNAEEMYESFKLSDGTQITGLPGFQYYRRQVKNEYKTGYNAATGKVELKVGKHIDNQGNFLPKTLADGAVGDKYINHDYERLRTNDPATFKVLEVMTKYHLKAQENLPYQNRLYLDVPRFRKHRQEYLRSGKAKEDTRNGLTRALKGIRALFRTEEDDYQQGHGNFEADQSLVSADLFDNEISKIPIKGTASMDIDQVSYDIAGSITRYYLSAEENRKKTEINPLFKALLNTLESNGVKDLKKINKSNWINRGVKTFLKKGKYNRLQILTNLYEREFLGMENKMELGAWANKMANQTMGLAAFGTLAMDIPGAAKNLFTARIQNFLESLGGRHVNYREYMAGTSDFTTQFMPAMIKDYGRLGVKSWQSQLFDLIDPVQDRFKKNVGGQYTKTALNDGINMTWMYAPREFGEMQAQGSLMLGMMRHQKIQQTIGGVTKEIMYKDAWTTDPSGKIVLKEGIDPAWGPNGVKFKEFKLLVQEINHKLQGNYADIDQAEIQRYTLGRMLGFMRRYAQPAFVNRFSKQRIQVGIGDVREGYYMTTFRMFTNFVKSHKNNWHLYDEEEKRAVMKTITELASSIIFMLLLSLLGYDDDDPQRFAKLQDNGWFVNHAILQLMQVKSETEQMTPFGGWDEVLRLINQPSLAIGQLNKYYVIGKDLQEWVRYGIGLAEDDSKLYYQNKQGAWDEGDSKLYAHTARLFGFTGKTLSPETAIRNFDLMQERVR